MLKEIRLIAVDLDGTLLDSRKRVPVEFPELVRNFTARGIRMVISSGRQYANLLKTFPGLAEYLTFVCENGALVCDGGRVIHADVLPREALAEPLRVIRETGAHPIFCGIKAAYVENSGPDFLRHCKLYYERLEVLPDVALAAEQDDIVKIAAFDLSGHAETGIYAALKRFEPEFAVTLSTSAWADLSNPGVGKGKGLRKLQEAFDLEPGNCLAFGDYLNDCSMMEACSWSVAMANAHPGLKALCRFETLSNDENGVIDWLQRHFSAAEQLAFSD